MAARAGTIAALRTRHRIIEAGSPEILGVEQDRALFGQRGVDGAQLGGRPDRRLQRGDPGVAVLLVFEYPVAAGLVVRAHRVGKVEVLPKRMHPI